LKWGIHDGRAATESFGRRAAAEFLGNKATSFDRSDYEPINPQSEATL
jgi:hypothetical protein